MKLKFFKGVQNFLILETKKNCAYFWYFLKLQHQNDKVQVKSTSCPWFIDLSKSNSLINFNSPCNPETFNLKLQKPLRISKRKENKQMKTKIFGVIILEKLLHIFKLFLYKFFNPHN